jgi:LuxR family maltose regulon positive regulatory protein
MLDSNPDRRLTIVCAPAGYGKSTLVAQWLTQPVLPTAWVTLNASDDDPRSYFGLIVSALDSIDAELAVTIRALLAAKRVSPDADAIVRNLIVDLSAITRSFVLVLDDYHVIEDQAIHRAMNLLLQDVPPTMRVVLISRSQPPLRLARLHANGEVFQLGAKDLQFTQDEAIRFYQEYLGLDLTPTEVQMFQERTEGWVAGLHLVGVALRGRPRERIQRFVEEFIGNVQIGDRYLWEEVLQRQPDEFQTFLMRTSVLDRFSAGLCDAVAEIDDGAAMIARCEREGLFLVPLDDSSLWYRYHHLFADVLRDRLIRTATDADLDALHRRAAEWLEEHEFIEDAVRHAIAGHVWDQAVRLLEGHCTTLFEREHVTELRGWLEGLPTSVLERSPQLAFWLAWALGRMSRWSEGAQPLRIAEAVWEATDDRLGRGLIMLWHSSRSLQTFDNRRAIEYANRALDLLPEDRPVERAMAMMKRGVGHLGQGEPLKAEQTFAAVRVLVDTDRLSWFQPLEMTWCADGLALQGKLLETAVLCRRAIRAAGDRPTELWAQAALHLLGDTYVEWGMLDDAVRCLRRADDLAEVTRFLQWRPEVCVDLARIAWARGAGEEALDEFERAIGFASQAGNHRQVRIARAWQARYWLSSGQDALARRWADSSELDPFLPPEFERQVEQLTYVRLLIQEDRPDLALRILGRIHARAEAAGRRGDFVELEVLTALAHRAGGDAAAALKAMHAALELGGPGGYFQTFANEGEGLAPLLRHATARGPHREYAQRLLAAIEGTAAAELPRQPDTPDALSEREIEVLRLVAAGLANSEIGRRLFISEKTVKKHVSNILAKLQVANRTQAVDQARRVGLL